MSFRQGRPAIGMIGAGWPPDVGGVESHMQDLARELVRRGRRIEVLCLDLSAEPDDCRLVRREVEPGIAVTRMAYRYGDHRALSDLANNPRTQRAALRWLHGARVQWLHVHHLTGFGAGLLPRLVERAPVLMTLHDYWCIDPRGQMFDESLGPQAAPDEGLLAAALQRTWGHLLPSGGAPALGPEGEPLQPAPGAGEDPFALDRAAARAYVDFGVVCLSRATALCTPSAAAREMFVRAGLPRESIEVVENGIEVDHLAAQVTESRRRLAPRAPGSPRRLGVLGTVLPSKGTLELAEAFAAAGLAGRLELHVHGNLPPYHGRADYTARLLALAEKTQGLFVHGPYSREQLAELLAGLDGVAAPSRWEEVYGLTVREARAAGLPVLVSDAGALPEVVRGGCGWVVPRDDRGAWMETLKRFAGDPSFLRPGWLQRLMPSLHARRVRPRTVARMTDQLEEIYARIRTGWPT